MKHLYAVAPLFAALVGAGTVARAQQSLQITVVVVDSASRRPIMRAAVEPAWSAASPASTSLAPLPPRFTDAAGLARFSIPAGAALDLTIRSIGFHAARRAVRPTSPDTIVVALVRFPVRLDAVVARADDDCPAGMGRAADAIAHWDVVTNAFAIAADYEADSTAAFEIRSFQRLRNEADSLTDESEIIEQGQAAPSISARSEAWLAANGFASRQNDAMEIEVPSPSVLRSAGFDHSHCFAVAGDSAGLVRLRFAPLLQSRGADIAGEMLLAPETLAPVSVRIDYLRVPLGRGADRVHAVLDFDRSGGASIYLRQWSLELPLFGSMLAGRPDGAISQGQVIRLDPPRDSAEKWANTPVRVQAGCGLLPLYACLTRGNDEWSGKLNGEVAQLRALAYYGAVCRAGPLRGMARIADSLTPELWPALVDSMSVAADSGVMRRRSDVLDALHSRPPRLLSRADQEVYAEVAQVDGCSRQALVLAREAEQLGQTAGTASTASLLASCSGGEGLACLWAASEIQSSDSSRDTAAAARRLIARACSLEVARACRVIRGASAAAAGAHAASIASSPSAVALLAPAAASRASVDSVARLLGDAFAGRPMTDLEIFPGGVLVSFFPDHTEPTRSDELEPADSTALGQIAALLSGRRDMRALVVLHRDPAPHEGLGRRLAADELDREAEAFERWLRRHGVRSNQFRVSSALGGEPAASASTLLGRQFDRRLEIAILLPRAGQ